MGYAFNPFTGNFDNTGGGGAQTYDEYIYNPSGAQSENRYNVWADLYAALNSGQDGIRRITFEESCTLPAGTYNFDNVIFNGSGVAPGLGGFYITMPTGFIISSWINMRITGSLGINYTGNVSAVTYSSGVNLAFLMDGSIIKTTTAPFFEANGSAVSVVALDNGSYITNDGYEPYKAIDSASVIFSVTQNSQIPNDTFRGDVTGGLLLISVDSAAAAYVTSRTDANLTGSPIVQLKSNSALITYDNATSGLAATIVQSAIDELQSTKTNYISRGTAKLDGNTVRDYRILGDALIGTVGTASPSANRWYFEPYVVSDAITLDRVGIEITTAAAAGKLARLSLWTADDYWQPATLVQDFGTVAIDPGAVPTLQTITLSPTLTLQPGRYIGVWIQDAAASYRVINCYNMPNNALADAGSTTPVRASFQSLNGTGTVASGFASASPLWERDLYTTTGLYPYYMRFRELV